MKKLQRYILKDLAKALVPAFLTLVGIMAIGLCLQLLNDGLDIVRLHALLPSLLAYCVPMVLPSAFLTAVIMAFGRLSADNELLAIRAAGISPMRVIYPVLGLAVLFSVVAAVFQFETMPQARGKLKALKYRALQQILLDHVALSARRQFSFGSAGGSFLIKYADFRDGEMIDLLAMEVVNRRPRNVFKAASCTIRPDPDEPEQNVVFEMDDCVITQFGTGERSSTHTIEAGKTTIRVPVAEDPEEVLLQERFLTTVPLLARLRELKQNVAEQKLFEDPAEAQEAFRAAQGRKRRELLNIRKTLDDLQSDHSKNTVQEPQLQDQILARSRTELAGLTRSLESLRKEQFEVQDEFSKQDPQGADWSRLEVLQKRWTALVGQVEATAEGIERLKKEIAKAEEMKRGFAEKAASLKLEIEELQVQEKRMRQVAGRLRMLRQWAEDQDDLREVNMRIHKRLAQAAAVFVFALLGIPIGILAGGRSVMIAFGISFGVVLAVYYPLLILGQVAADVGALPAVPALWGGNALTAVIGLALMAGVMRK
jgi:lipopolysaccharide export LptBFGC system permease protein LptF